MQLCRFKQTHRASVFVLLLHPYDMPALILEPPQPRVAPCNSNLEGEIATWEAVND